MSKPSFKIGDLVKGIGGAVGLIVDVVYMEVDLYETKEVHYLIKYLNGEDTILSNSNWWLPEEIIDIA